MTTETLKLHFDLYSCVKPKLDMDVWLRVQAPFLVLRNMEGYIAYHMYYTSQEKKEAENTTPFIL